MTDPVLDPHSYDVVVVGSGAAGMTAALTAAHHGLRVVVLEKAAHYGGSTARSGGGVWIPGNKALRASGVLASMGAVGTAYDNAMCESFFATLKEELIYRRSWETRHELEEKAKSCARWRPMVTVWRCARCRWGNRCRTIR